MLWSRNGFFWLLLLTLLWLAAENPVSAASKQVERGHALYLQYCASCHGASDGRGRRSDSAIIDYPTRQPAQT
jgi:mono/diheme cytochrome c family protein